MNQKEFMSDQEFVAHMDQLIPAPSPETNSNLLDLSHGLWLEMKDDLYHALSFVSHHFSRDVLQGVYDLCGGREQGLLPWEIIGAAIYLQTGTPADEISNAEWNDFVILSTPESANALSSLAACTVAENGREELFYTIHFGKSDPQKLLDTAIDRAGKAGITVTEALRQLDYNLPEIESHVTAQKAILEPGSRMAEKLLQLMPSSPATAAHIVYDVDRGTVSVERNPLWEKLRDEIRDVPPPQREKRPMRKRAPNRKRQQDR